MCVTCIMFLLYVALVCCVLFAFEHVSVRCIFLCVCLCVCLYVGVLCECVYVLSVVCMCVWFEWCACL